MKEIIAGIKSKLIRNNISSVFITSPYNISYITNLFPSTIEEREYYLFITKNKSYLIAPKMFMMAIKHKTEDFSYIEITEKKGLYENILSICKEENINSVGFEKDNILYKEFEHLEELLGDIELIPFEDFIEEERQIKNSYEVEKIKKACDITDSCYKEILDLIKIGVTEIELASEIEFYLNRFGGNAFKPIVAFGKNSSIPHHIPDDTKLSKDSFVLFDFGAKFEGYCSDMSRTIYFGNPSEKEKSIYRTVLEAQNIALEKLKEWQNKDFEESYLHTIAESHIEKNGFASFPHSLGHGMGLEVHELPTISKFSIGNNLSKNTVITIEPAIYEPEIGGVRIEDDILLTNNGYEILTKSPKQLTVIQ